MASKSWRSQTAQEGVPVMGRSADKCIIGGILLIALEADVAQQNYHIKIALSSA